MWLIPDIVAWDSFWHGSHYLFSDIDAAATIWEYVFENT